MGLREQLMDDLKDAMRANDVPRKRTIRSIIAAIKKAETELDASGERKHLDERDADEHRGAELTGNLGRRGDAPFSGMGFLRNTDLHVFASVRSGRDYGRAAFNRQSGCRMIGGREDKE